MVSSTCVYSNTRTFLYSILNNQIENSIKINASDGNEYDEYSISASLNSTHLVVGAHFDDDLGDDSGSIYLYSYRGCSNESSCNYNANTFFIDNCAVSSISL